MVRISPKRLLSFAPALALALSAQAAAAFELEYSQPDNEAPQDLMIVQTPGIRSDKDDSSSKFKRYHKSARFKPAPAIEELDESTLLDQFEGGGLSYLVAHHVTPPFPNDKHLKLKWNRMKFHIDNYNLSAILEIQTKKIYEPDDEFENSSDEDCDCAKKEFTYDWVIAIKPGGLRSGPITNGEMNYKYFARGDQIEIVSFAINGKTVKYFNDKGEINPLAKVYMPNSDDCIEIDVRHELNGDGTIKSPSVKKLNFCAGSCSGYLLAATR